MLKSFSNFVNNLKKNLIIMNFQLLSQWTVIFHLNFSTPHQKFNASYALKINSITFFLTKSTFSCDLIKLYT